MLGSNWLETLGTFTFNTEQKAMTFFHEKKKITIHDSSARVPSSQNTDQESPYGSYENLKEQVKHLNKLLMDKDRKMVQIQKK